MCSTRPPKHIELEIILCELIDLIEDYAGECSGFETACDALDGLRNHAVELYKRAKLKDA